MTTFYLNLCNLPTDVLGEVATYLPLPALPSLLTTSRAFCKIMFDSHWKCMAEAHYGAQHFDMIFSKSRAVPSAASIPWETRLKMRALLSAYEPTAAQREAQPEPGSCPYALALVTSVPDFSVWPPRISPLTFVAGCGSKAAQFPAGDVGDGGDGEGSGLGEQNHKNASFKFNAYESPLFLRDIFKPNTPRFDSAMAEIKSGVNHLTTALGAPLGDEQQQNASASDVMRELKRHLDETCDEQGNLLSDEQLETSACTLTGLFHRFLPSQMPALSNAMGLREVDVFAIERSTGRMVLIDHCELKWDAEFGPGFMTRDFSADGCRLFGVTPHAYSARNEAGRSPCLSGYIVCFEVFLRKVKNNDIVDWDRMTSEERANIFKDLFK
jgi:hypothetical protein